MIPHRRRALTIYILALLTLMSFGIRAAASTPAEYVRALNAISSGLQTALGMEKAHIGSSGPVLDGITKTMPKSMPVTLGHGQSINADLSWIKDGLRSIRNAKPKHRAEKLSELIGRVQTAAVVGQSAMPGHGASSTEARAILAKILARDEYRPSVINDWVVRLMNVIGDVIGSILETIPKGAWGVIGYVLLAIAVLVFVACIVMLVLMLVRRRSNPNAHGRPAQDRPERKSKRPSLELLIQSAEDEASRGQYREAFRNIYLATLLMLDHAHLITYTEGNTNWEYMRVLRREAPGELARLFGDMTLLFDQSIYGRHTVSQEDYLESKSRFRELEGTL